MVSESDLKERLTVAFNPSYLEVEDESDGCGAKFRIVVVSDEFKGKTTLASHRLVQGALKEEIPLIHALTIKAVTEEKWKAEGTQ